MRCGQHLLIRWQRQLELDKTQAFFFRMVEAGEQRVYVGVLKVVSRLLNLVLVLNIRVAPST